MTPKHSPEDPNPVTRVLPSGEVPFLPGVYQGGPVGTIVLPLHPVHADSGVGDGPVRLLGRQVCFVQRLFEEFQFSHCHFAVFRYSALHVKDQVLACGGVRVEDFSCHACARWEQKRQPVIAILLSKAPTLCPQLSSQHTPSTLPYPALVPETATKHTFSNAYLNQCLANALILLLCLSLCNLEERNLLYNLTPN